MVDQSGVRDLPLKANDARRGPGWGLWAGLALVLLASLSQLIGLPAELLWVSGVAGILGAGLVAVSALRERRDTEPPVAAVQVQAVMEPPQVREPEPQPVAEPVPVVGRLERLLECVADMAPVGVVIVDSDETIHHVNEEARRMSAAETAAEGRKLADLFSDADAGAVRTLFTRALSGQTGAAAVDLKLRSDADRVVQAHGGLLDEPGDAPVAVFFLVETTQQRSLEAQFAQGQRMQAVGQLAGGVAHDFNNLLTAMIGFADLLLMRHPPGDPSYADIVHIKQNANRAAALVRQLLAFSRRQTLRPKILNLTDVLTDLSDLLRRLIGEHLNIRIVHERDLGLVRADQGQIEQVVTNLVVNARDALDSGGTVTITTNNLKVETGRRGAGGEPVPVGDYVEIEVADTGHGISDENLAKIFEPFFTTKPIGQGTGLGLATVYGIVRQTGGFVEVESEVGQGTTFRVLLPRVEDESGRDSRRSRSQAVDLTGTGTVLLVEDEDAVRLFAARALRNKGYNLIEAESGDAALEIIQKRADEIDLMISDVVMPNMDGPTLIRRARELKPDIRAVFISGYAEEAFRRSLGEDLGDIDLLPKPFSLKQLAQKVKEQLEG